jgi:hypothetical protein
MVEARHGNQSSVERRKWLEKKHSDLCTNENASPTDMVNIISQMIY